MKALFDFSPKYCPNCGEDMRHIDNDNDYTRAHCSFTCGCGVQYQKADTDKILKAAEDSGGDMAFFARMHE